MNELTEALALLITNIANLLKVKSFVTVSMTIGMILMLSGVFNPPQAILAIYSTAYGCVITYYFTKDDKKPEPQIIETATIIRPEEEEGVYRD